MAQLVIEAIECKSPCSGIDAEVIEQASGVLSEAMKAGAGVAGTVKGYETVGEALKAASAVLAKAPGLIAAIDKASNSPDELYLNLSNQPGENKLWPFDKKYEKINKGQIVRPEFCLSFSQAIDINLWEYDSVSSDDFIGRLTIDASKTEAGKFYSQIIESKEEGALYVVAYSVLPTRDRLSADEYLRPGESLYSTNNKYSLEYQTDGNLVIYKSTGAGKQALWASNTNNKPAWRCVMQEDGNLVVYGSQNNALWASGVYGSQYAGSKLIMQDDGNLVIYDKNDKSIWASGTNNR